MAGDMKFLTVEDVAEMLQVTRTTIYNLKRNRDSRLSSLARTSDSMRRM